MHLFDHIRDNIWEFTFAKYTKMISLDQNIITNIIGVLLFVVVLFFIISKHLCEFLLLYLPPVWGESDEK